MNQLSITAVKNDITANNANIPLSNRIIATTTHVEVSRKLDNCVISSNPVLSSNLIHVNDMKANTNSKVSRALHPNRRPLSSGTGYINSGISISQPPLRPGSHDSVTEGPVTNDWTVSSIGNVMNTHAQMLHILNHRESLLPVQNNDVIAAPAVLPLPVPISPMTKGHSGSNTVSGQGIDITSTVGRGTGYQHHYSPINHTPPTAYPLQSGVDSPMEVARYNIPESTNDSYVTEADGVETVQSEEFVYDLTTANYFVMNEDGDTCESKDDISDSNNISLQYSNSTEAKSTAEEEIQTITNPAESSMLSECSANNTTITMNNDFEATSVLTGHNAPMLLVKSIPSAQRQLQDTSAMKELLLVSNKLQVSTTIKLTFGNSKSAPLHITSRAVMTRYDPYHLGSYHIMPTSHLGDNSSSQEVFQVSPYKLTIAQGGVGVMYITFVPTIGYGVYSGALKLKSNRKVSITKLII